MGYVIETGRELASVAFADAEPELRTDQDLCYVPGEIAPWPVRISFELIGACAPRSALGPDRGRP